MRITLFLAVFVIVGLTVGCTDRPASAPQATINPIVAPDPNPDPGPDPVVIRTTAELTASEKSLLSSCNKFGLDLFRQVVANTPATENVFISPLSVSYALGLCYDGANGATRDAIGNTLQVAGLSIDEMNKAYHDLTEILVKADPDVDFRVANSFWSRKGKAIQPGFIDLAQTWFDARVEEIDLQAPWAADTINGWVSEATNDKITKMVEPPISPDIAAMLFNAIYFKGSWMFPFDTADTRDCTFRRADGSTTTCRMMLKSSADCQQGDTTAWWAERTDTNITWYGDSEVFVLGMPYGRGDYRMSIVVPSCWSEDPNSDCGKSIDEIISGLTDEKWSTWRNGHTPNEFDLFLPRFKFGYEVGLTDVLKSLGMQIAFVPGQADFSNLFADSVGWIDAVKQKTFIQVDEKGTEAAAVTQVIFADSVTPAIICNRPFLIVIHEDVSGAILFMGRIANPVWESD